MNTALTIISVLKASIMRSFVTPSTTSMVPYIRMGSKNFWSLLKRFIKGTYVSVEPFHMFRYLDEEAFRFNEREGDDRDRFLTAVRCLRSSRYIQTTQRQGWCLRTKRQRRGKR